MEEIEIMKDENEELDYDEYEDDEDFEDYDFDYTITELLTASNLFIQFIFSDAEGEEKKEELYNALNLLPAVLGSKETIIKLLNEMCKNYIKQHAEE